MLSQTFVELRKVVFSQQQNVVSAIAQGRQVNLNHRKAVVKIESKPPRIALGFQVAIGSCYNAHVERQILQSAYAAKRSLFQDPKQVCLQPQLKLAYLVQEERAALRLLEQAFFTPLRVGESAFFMTEQFALDQCRRDRRAIDGDEWLVGARRSVMDRFGDEVLTRAAFAEQQYRRGFALRDLAREPDHLGHGRRLADDLIEAESLLLLPPQEPNLAPESAGLDPVADGDLEFAEPDRLTDEIVSAAAQRRDRVLEMNVARDHDHDGLRLAPLVFEQGVESGSVGQIDVLQHRRRPLRVEGLQRRRHRRGFERFVSPATQRLCQRVANRRIVINYEHFLFWHSPAFLKKYAPLRH